MELGHFQCHNMSYFGGYIIIDTLEHIRILRTVPILAVLQCFGICQVILNCIKMNKNNLLKFSYYQEISIRLLAFQSLSSY